MDCGECGFQGDDPAMVKELKDLSFITSITRSDAEIMH